MIGDPSGRSEERNLITDDALAANMERIVPQLRRFLDFDGGAATARLHDNRSWTLSMSALDFLRDVGKYVTVNQMLSRDSVKSRLNSAHGISYTEFSYMLLQANDFLRLAELEGCELQVGGSDQWGNIVAGVDLIRRRLARSVHAQTVPLLLRADGTKYGKTASGEQLWLGAHRMSPYRFYQAWVQVDDSDVRKLLLQLTLLDVQVVHQIADEHEAQPHLRAAQRRLAWELTALVHGEAAAQESVAATDVLFGATPANATAETLTMIAEEIPSTTVTYEQIASGCTPVDLAVMTGVSSSRAEARRTIGQQGLRLNGRLVTEVDSPIDATSLLHGRFLLLRKGKANYHLIVAISG